MELTESQKLAAEAAGSVAVTAGAGTGKTRMLAERYLHHVRSDRLSPLSIVAVTFTEKAAAELRSRIRETLSLKLGDEKITAEVEAAQISTMHSLASRICRDFYDLAGIPADFSVLNETDSPLWSAEKFDEALSGIDLDIAEGLGFKWLAGALQILLKEPLASEKALSLGADNWRNAVDEARIGAVNNLLSSDAWSDADCYLCECQGAVGDKLESIRADVVAAMKASRPEAGLQELYSALKGFRSNSGSAKNWNAAHLERVRGCLIALRDKLRENIDIALLTFGPEDEEAARRIPPLEAAFRHVREHIATEKLREKVLDFNDLEHYALKILRYPEAVEHYRARWQAFLIDEFQDTNSIQAEILSLLTSDAKLTIVGDEKQSIYGFRGADIEVFGRVRDKIVRDRLGAEVPLDLTFRTHHELVVKTNSIFKTVLGERHQELVAYRSETALQAPFIHSAVVENIKGTSNTQKQIIEARYIAAQIKKLHDDENVTYGDIAIIGRRWAPLETYLNVLSANGIPALNAGGGSLLNTREALDIYSLLSFLADPHDNIPLVAVLRSPYFAFSDRVLFEAAAYLKNDRSWWDVIRTQPEFAAAVQILEKLIAAGKFHSAEYLLRLADRLTGYGSIIANLPQGSRRVADMNGVCELLRRLEGRGRGDVFGVARHLRELYETETEIPRPPLDAGDAVSLMTIHKAKGLEWSIVFVPDLGADRVSDSSPILVDRDLGVAFQMDGEDYEKSVPAIHKLIKLRKREREQDEARRLLYVAVTRAKEKVFLTAAKEKGLDIDLLKPGLDVAGIQQEIIPFDEAAAIAPSPGDPTPLPEPSAINIASVNRGLRELPVTALTVYAKCAKRFEFQFVNGNPGLSSGVGTAMALGSLTHLTLEHGIDEIATLHLESPTSSQEMLVSALELANRFRSGSAFAEIQSDKHRKEVEFVMTVDGVKLAGTVDLLGDDFVLDYKTDIEMNPVEHRFQLWAYARAFEKEKAYIAYVGHNSLHKFGSDELLGIEKETTDLIHRIKSGEYEPTPSESACQFCRYREVCEFRFAVTQIDSVS